MTAAAKALWLTRALGPTIAVIGVSVYVAFRPLRMLERVIEWAYLVCALQALLILIELSVSSIAGKRQSFLWREIRSDWGLDRVIRPGFFWAVIAMTWLMSAIVLFVRGSPQVLTLVLSVNAACLVSGWYFRRRLRVLSLAPYAAAFTVGMLLIAWMVGRYAQ